MTKVIHNEENDILSDLYNYQLYPVYNKDLARWHKNQRAIKNDRRIRNIRKLAILLLVVQIINFYFLFIKAY